MVRPDPALVAECFAENRTRLLSIIGAVRPAIPANIETKKEAATDGKR